MLRSHIILHVGIISSVNRSYGIPGLQSSFNCQSTFLAKTESSNALNAFTPSKRLQNSFVSVFTTTVSCMLYLWETRPLQGCIRCLQFQFKWCSSPRLLISVTLLIWRLRITLLCYFLYPVFFVPSSIGTFYSSWCLSWPEGKSKPIPITCRRFLVRLGWWVLPPSTSRCRLQSVCYFFRLRHQP